MAGSSFSGKVAGARRALGDYSAIVKKQETDVWAEDEYGKTITEGEAGVDDAEVIQSALRILESMDGGVLKVMKGEYLINDTLSFTAQNMILDFENSTFKYSSNVGIFIKDAYNFKLKNLNILRDPPGRGGSIVFLAEDPNKRRENIKISNIHTYGIYGAHIIFYAGTGRGLIPSVNDPNFPTALEQYGHYNVIVENCCCERGYLGGLSNGLITVNSAYNIIISNCVLKQNYDAGIYVACPRVNIKGCVFEACGAGNGAIYLDGGAYGTARNISIKNSVFRGNEIPFDITITSATDILIENCQFIRPYYYAIRTKAATYSPEFRGIIVRNCRFKDIPWSAIYLSAPIYDSEIVRNTFYSCGVNPIEATSKGNRTGIHFISNGSDNVKIECNLFDSCYNCITVRTDYRQGYVYILNNDFVNTINNPIDTYPYIASLWEVAKLLIKYNEPSWSRLSFLHTDDNVTIGGGSYGLPTTIYSGTGIITSFDAILHVTAGVGEVITVKFECVWDDGTTTYITKSLDNSAGTAAASQDFEITAADKIALWKNNSSLRKINVYAMSNLNPPTSDAKVTVDIAGSG